MRTESSNRLRQTALLATVLAVATGCATHTRCEYGSQVVALDDRNELVLSTFPSGFAQIRRHIPFLFKQLESVSSVKFEFFVRAAGTTAGRNPNIDSILVRSFSYEFPGQAPVVLMENYPDGFWQQGQVEYQSDQLPPVSCAEGWYLRARFDLLLNGRTFTGAATMVAVEKKRVYPLLLDAMR